MIVGKFIDVLKNLSLNLTMGETYKPSKFLLLHLFFLDVHIRFGQGKT